MSMALKYGLKKRMAKGGKVKGVHEPLGSSGKGGQSDAGNDIMSANEPYSRPDEPYVKHAIGEAKRKHAGKLSELKAMPKPNLPMAEGGDIVERAMKKYGCYSEGGRVANDDEPMADDMPAEFDDLALDDNLHADFPEGGNEHGHDAEDEDRKDIVSRAMKSRAKKDRMPRPA